MRFALDRSEWFKQKINCLPSTALLGILFTFVISSSCSAEVWVYPMQYRPASEALPSIQTMYVAYFSAIIDT